MTETSSTDHGCVSELPVVAIAGRPNVGKSTLFNAFSRRRISIVEPTPGVTRDRISIEVEHVGKRFELIDTGGIGVVDCDALDSLIAFQIDLGLERADLVLFVTSVREGVTALDREIAQRLRKSGKKVILAVNKIDHPHMETGMYEFCELGLGDPSPVSALEGFGRTDLLDEIADRLPLYAPSAETDAMRLAVVGRRNVGKSTLVNAICKSDRVIVSPVPGTTRDSVDVRLRVGGSDLILVDTAGLQKTKQVKGSIEFYSQVRTESSIRRCDVVLFLLDAVRPVGELERRIGHLIMEAYKPCVLVANKWDLAEGEMRTKHFSDYVWELLPQLRHSPMVVTSATAGKNLRMAVNTARSLFKQATTRVSTSRVNEVLAKARDKQRPRAKSFIPRIYYGTQVDVAPPTFLLFVNKPKVFDNSYRRYLSHQFQEGLGFPEVPLRFVFKERRSFFEGGHPPQGRS